MTITTELAAALTGRYVVEREIGRGGMAVVYLARDTKHDRPVAVKVLNPELTASLGAERFLSEIKTTATLQHPNLLPLFDSGEAGGLLYYVMPYIDGESLRARLDREQQLPIEDAVRIATGIANALSYAHGRGVIHRDLKPENVLLQHGQPVVLDFGIALALQNAASDRKTLTGISVGTPQYMSPEQAAGEKSIDARADVYALGALTYEMLGGEPPFTGRTTQAVIAKAMVGDVRPVTTVRPSVPTHIATAVHRALARVPADRFSSAADYARALEHQPVTSEGPAPAPTVDTGSRGRELIAWSLAAVAIAVAAWSVLRPSRSVGADTEVIRAALVAPDGMTPDVNSIGAVAITRDGERIAYAIRGEMPDRIVIRRINEAAGRDIIVSRPRDLAFSPDGKWLAYFTDGSVYKVAVDAGAPIQLVKNLPRILRGMTWWSRDTLIASTDVNLIAIPANGGSAVTRDSVPLRYPITLPNGALLGTRGDTIVAVKGGARAAISKDIQAQMPLGILEGHLLYDANDALMAVPFDAEQLRPTGAPFVVIDSIRMNPALGSFGAVSASGTLIYARGLPDNQLVLASTSATTPRVLRADGPFFNPRFSPDGRRIAFVKSSDVYVMNVGDGTVARLTTDGANNDVPEWTSDGRRIVGVARRGTKAWSIAPDGSAAKEVLAMPPWMIAPEIVPVPGGRWVLLRASAARRRSDGPVYMAPASELMAAGPLINSAARIVMPRVSPDGRWIAYSSDEGGRFDVYVTSFPKPGNPIQVSENGGVEPLWNSGSDVIYYRTGNQLIAAKLRQSGGLAVESRSIALTGDYELDLRSAHQNYDVSPDGKSFLMLKVVNRGLPPIIAYNWQREFRAMIQARPH